MEDFEKIVRLGTNDCGDVFCKIRYNDKCLSITGVEGPTHNGNARGSCGQIVDSLETIDTFAPEWSAGKVKTFALMWRKWHLNDMQAASPRQRYLIEKHADCPKTSPDYYKWACALLKEHDAFDDATWLHHGKPYRYGSAWLKIVVPDHVVRSLRELPDTDKIPAWV